MRLLLVADGERDRVAIPKLIETLLNVTVEVQLNEWKKIQLARSSGYKRKLQFAMRRARDASFDGVVATIDADAAGVTTRLSELSTARSIDRQDPALTALRTAIGEAVPHLEAWLLDDEKAVRTVLLLEATVALPSVAKCDPKTTLDALISESERAESHNALIGEIASQVLIDRCTHSKATGLQDFANEIEREFAIR